MKAFKFALIFSALSLAACNGNVDRDGMMSEKSMSYSEPMPVMAADSMGGRANFETADMAPRQVIEPEPTDNPTSQSYLEYRYNYGFALPPRAVIPTMEDHVRLCEKAGPELCQILNSSSNSANEDYVNAYVSLRAEPEWLKSFAEQIQASVNEAKGEMVTSGVSATDLTRQIIDTDSRLKAQTTLRSRLQALLETRDAKLPDLLALERELARVQSEIESATTTLAALRKRVSMSTVDINYQSQQPSVSRNVFSPIIIALKGFFGTFATGLGNVINFLAYILPWIAFIIIPFFFVVRWLLRRRSAAKMQAAKKVSQTHKAANS